MSIVIGSHRGFPPKSAFISGCAVLVSGLALAPAAAVELQPHRIAYEVSLGPKSNSSSFSAARGLIVLEFTGNRCEGYVTKFRQATEISDADGRARNLDFRVNLWEEGAGKTFRFTVKNEVNGQITRDADGEAKRVADGSIAVAMTKPRGKKGDFDGAISFPSAMMVAMVEAAEKGTRRFDAKVFDGSEGGEKVYDTVATIGNPLEGERNARLEPAMRGGALDAVKRWPMTVAYYDSTPGDRVPVYTLKSVTFANGVVSDLRFDFPDFSLVARAARYEALPVKPCDR